MSKIFSDRFKYLPIKGKNYLDQIKNALNSETEEVSLIMIETPSNPLL